MVFLVGLSEYDQMMYEDESTPDLSVLYSCAPGLSFYIRIVWTRL